MLALVHSKARSLHTGRLRPRQQRAGSTHQASELTKAPGGQEEGVGANRQRGAAAAAAAAKAAGQGLGAAGAVGRAAPAAAPAKGGAAPAAAGRGSRAPGAPAGGRRGAAPAARAPAKRAAAAREAAPAKGRAAHAAAAACRKGRRSRRQGERDGHAGGACDAQHALAQARCGRRRRRRRRHEGAAIHLGLGRHRDAASRKLPPGSGLSEAARGGSTGAARASRPGLLAPQRQAIRPGLHAKLHGWRNGAGWGEGRRVARRPSGFSLRHWPGDRSEQTVRRSIGSCGAIGEALSPRRPMQTPSHPRSAGPRRLAKPPQTTPAVSGVCFQRAERALARAGSRASPTSRPCALQPAHQRPKPLLPWPSPV